jgi:hypothetical protein
MDSDFFPRHPSAPRAKNNNDDERWTASFGTAAATPIALITHPLSSSRPNIFISFRFLSFDN